MAYHKEAQFEFRLGFKDDEFPIALTTMDRMKTGELFTDQLDYASFGANVGQDATIQIKSVDDHVVSYRCIDVTFIQ